MAKHFFELWLEGFDEVTKEGHIILLGDSGELSGSGVGPGGPGGPGPPGGPNLPPGPPGTGPRPGNLRYQSK